MKTASVRLSLGSSKLTLVTVHQYDRHSEDDEYDDGKRVVRKGNDEYSHKKGQVCYQVLHPFSLQRNVYRQN